MGAVNGELLYEENSGGYVGVKISGIVLRMVCVLFFLVSTYFHKMIGL